MTGGQWPLGWYTGRDSPNTRRLVADAGGFAYDSDHYGDELPFWTQGAGFQQAVIDAAAASRLAIGEALTNNWDIQIAAARVLQAEAALKIARSQYLPSINAGGDIYTSLEKGSIDGAEFVVVTISTGGFDSMRHDLEIRPRPPGSHRPHRDHPQQDKHGRNDGDGDAEPRQVLNQR